MQSPIFCSENLLKSSSIGKLHFFCYLNLLEKRYKLVKRYFMNPNFFKNNRLIFLVCSSLFLSSPVIIKPGFAQLQPLNPCVNNPNSPNCSAVTPTTPPLPEVIDRVELVNEVVNVRLINQTYTRITYQVLGDTRPRRLSGQSEVLLKSLKAPVTITFQRPDGGLLQVQTQTSEAGLVEVGFKETTDLGLGKTAMTIQEDGGITLN